MKRLHIVSARILLAAVLLTQAAPTFAYPYWQFPAAIPFFENVAATPQVEPTLSPIMEQEVIRIRIIQPIADDRPVTRAQFIMQVIQELYPEGIPTACFEQLSPSRYWLLFSDVPTDAPYGPQLCAAMIAGLVDGYSDATFRPNASINYAEASKILAKAFALASDPTDPTVAWYAPFVKAMRAHNALPSNVELDDLVIGQNMRIMIALAQP
ncbi:MAG: S-layer homology domain-containing protein [Candidatus Peribacteraceae bacterium]|jgi:hypothetical protein